MIIVISFVTVVKLMFFFFLVWRMMCMWMWQKPMLAYVISGALIALRTNLNLRHQVRHPEFDR